MAWAEGPWSDLTWAGNLLSATSAALSGTVTAASEVDIVVGGKTIILTLTGDTWVTAGATFDGQRANIIAEIGRASCRERV